MSNVTAFFEPLQQDKSKAEQLLLCTGPHLIVCTGITHLAAITAHRNFWAACALWTKKANQLSENWTQMELAQS